jgi:hypothetical protein
LADRQKAWEVGVDDEDLPYDIMVVIYLSDLALYIPQ